MFPLRLKNGDPPPIFEEAISELEKQKQRQASRLSDSELKKKAGNITGRPGQRLITSTQYQRNQNIIEHAKRRANGICQLCKQEAPFKTKDNKPYLETHHIVWLAKGGSDTIDNTVALCPNCHRKVHHMETMSDLNTMKAAANSDS